LTYASADKGIVHAAPQLKRLSERSGAYAQSHWSGSVGHATIIAIALAVGAYGTAVSGAATIAVIVATTSHKRLHAGPYGPGDRLAEPMELYGDGLHLRAVRDGDPMKLHPYVTGVC
jgi:hypothetical protein